MSMFEETIAAMSERLDLMPVENVRGLAQSLGRLNPTLERIICDTLERAFVEERLTFGKYRFFEYFFETWRRHGLETKLAAIAQVAALAAPGTWPDDVLPNLPDVGAPEEAEVMT